MIQEECIEQFIVLSFTTSHYRGQRKVCFLVTLLSYQLVSLDIDPAGVLYHIGFTERF